MGVSDIAAEAADRIITHGWTQNDWVGPGGAECLHQAVRACSPQTGDGYVVSAYLTAVGYTTGWNDDEDRVRDDVLSLLKGIDITDRDLEDVFGSKWRRVVDVIRRAAVMTEGQSEHLTAAMTAARDVARAAARAAAMTATGDVVKAAAMTARITARIAGNAARAARAAWDAARSAGDAAAAYMTYDLVGTDGYTQTHYDTLVAPWETVFGKENLPDPA